MRRLQVAFPFLLFVAMTAVVAASVWSGKSASAAASGRLSDPVCKMEVNAAWGYSAAFDGREFHFCCKGCRETFLADPAVYTTVRCIVCGAAMGKAPGLPVTYLGATYRVCSAADRSRFKEEPASYFLHRMLGIPEWLYYVSIGFVMLVSFLMFERAGIAPDVAGPRIDLMKLGPVRWALTTRPVRFAAQLLCVLAFGLIIAAGLYGDQNPARNLAPLLTWTVWWGGLVVLILFAGKAWCWVCPWDAVASWAERLHPWKKASEGGGLDLPWPRALRNVWLATALFVGLTWIELGFGVTMKPWATAWLAIGMLVMAVVSAFLFDRKSFCRYGCLVGRVSGLYAMFSSVEIRRRDAGVCASCRPKPCVTGSSTAYGCPTFQYPGGMATNTYCIQCTECLQACPSDNLAVNLRPWGSDLAVEGRPRSDEAYLALLMLAISGFHGLTMTPIWSELTRWFQSILPGGHMVAFSTGMAGLMILPVTIYAALAGLSLSIARRVAPQKAGGISYRDYFVRYAYCLLPIALFYHLAHNLEHLLMEGPKVLILLSDPLGRGWDLFGTANWTVPPMVSLQALWGLQVVLVAIGHVYSLWAASRIGRRLFGDARAATASQWPLLAGMIAFSVFSLWLLKQPMEMRNSVM